MTFSCPICGVEVGKSKNGRLKYCSILCSIEAKIDKTSECWIWEWCVYKDGYGEGTWEKQRFFAHRVMCELAHGQRSDGQQVLHSCHNTSCCNPDHLRWGTSGENKTDSMHAGTIPKGEMHWKSRLTESDVMLIRSSSLSTAVLARQFEVNWSTVSHVRKGNTWKHLNAVT